MEAFTVFGAGVWFTITLIVLLITWFIADISENGFVAFWSVIWFCVVMYVWGTYDLSWLTWTNLGFYLGAGLIHALVRSFFLGRDEAKAVIKHKAEWDSINRNTTWEESTKLLIIQQEHKIKSHFFRWAFIWPASLLVWIVGDWLKDLASWAYDSLKEQLETIKKAGYKSVKQ